MPRSRRVLANSSNKLGIVQPELEQLKMAYPRVWLIAVLAWLMGCTPTTPTTQPTTDSLPSVSSSIARSSDGTAVWVVNPDADSVTRINASTLEIDAPIAVGHEPWSVAVAPNNTVLVVNRAGGTLSILANGTRSDLEVGAEPAGVALSPSGKTAFVTISAENAVAVIDLDSRQVIKRLQVGYMPWALAVTDNGDDSDSDETLIVTHRFSRLRPGGAEGLNDGKEGWLSLVRNASSSAPVFSETTIAPYNFGYANGLEGLAVTGDTIFVSHLLNSPDLPQDLRRRFETTVSAALSTISLSGSAELIEQRVHINETEFSTPVNFPRAIAVTKDAKRAFIVLAGTNAVMGINLENPNKPKLIGFWATGKNPRGLVLSSDETKAFVMNYLSRDVSILDLSDTVTRRELKRLSVTSETLKPEILLGKQLFNNANDPRISHLGWISCGTCHFDGGIDGTTWTTPDGARQTQPLWNLKGTAPFHASATRDEVQDFEHDIEGLMDGIGLAPENAQRELGQPNAGLSKDLDALAKYVLEGIHVPDAPQFDESAIAQGRTVFTKAGCSSCHSGMQWTNSALSVPVTNNDIEVRSSLHDVGTFKVGRDILGEHGFDVPTLLGLASSAPYLHDGSAKTLADVLENPKHVSGNLSAQEKTSLVEFLQSIDSNSRTFVRP